MSDPSDQRCDTCRHWGERTDTTGDVFRVCKAIVHSMVYEQHCNEDELSTNTWDESPEHIAGIQAFRDSHLAVVTDAEHFRAELRTKADFACVLWQPKPVDLDFGLFRPGTVSTPALVFRIDTGSVNPSERGSWTSG